MAILDSLKGTIARAFKGKLYRGFLRRKSVTGLDELGDPIVGSTTRYAFEGIREEVSAFWRAQAGIPESDSIFLILLGSIKVQPKQGDVLEWEGLLWEIRRVEIDPVGATARVQAYPVAEYTPVEEDDTDTGTGTDDGDDSGDGTGETSPQPLPWELMPDASEMTLSINGVLQAANTTREDPILIPPGATQAHVKLTFNGTMDGEIVSTAFVYATVKAEQMVGFSADDLQAPEYAYYWRPGDDVDHWVTIDIVNPSNTAGHQFKVNFSGSGITGPVACIFKIAGDAVNELPDTLPHHRPPYRLDLSGATPKVEQDMGEIEWSDTGYVGNADSGTPCWRARHSHGYSNFSGNQENGLYTNTDKFPDEAIDPQTKETDSNGRAFVRLHAAKFPEPVNFSGIDFPFQASVLQAQRIPDWHHKTGVYRAQVVCPSQHGCWHAFWAVGVRPSTGASIWPPEIDFFEHFNGAFGADYDEMLSHAGQHVGVHGSNEREKVVGVDARMDRLGFADDFNLWSQIHDFACVIDDDWITHFIDGIEVVQYRNMTAASDGNDDWAFYPIMQVAVKEPSSSSFDEGTTDLLWYGIQYYDTGYEMVAFEDERPWSNRKITPDPDGFAVGDITDLTATALSATEVQLAFTPAENADSHEYRVDGGTAQDLPSGAVISGLSPATTYTFEVRGKNDFGVGDWSNVASVTTEFSFATIEANPVLWLDASDEDSITATDGGVSQWADKSGNQNHAVQPTSGRQPKTGERTMGSPASNVLVFDGSDDSLALTNEIDHAGGYTIFAVVQPDAVTGRGVILSTDTAGGFTLRTNSGVVQAARMNQAVLVSEDTLEVGTPYVIATRVSSSGTDLWTGGGTGATSAIDPSLSHGLKRIGAQGGPTDYWKGAIAEILVFDETLEDADVNTVGEYLSAKWGAVWSEI